MKFSFLKYYKNSKNLFKTFFFLLFLGLITTGSIILYFYYESYKKFPNLYENIPHLQKSPEIILLDNNNHTINYSLKSRKIIVNYKDIPKKLIKTLIAVEDKNFFTHKGISILSTVRSILLLPIFLLLGKRPWGASTITQQLIRNLFLNMNYSYLRKIREIILAFRIEKELTKQEILTLYLNMIYFGRGKYGIGTAAKSFFNKNLKDLSPEEIAFLIATIKNPSFSLSSFHDEALIRRNFVLETMVHNQIIDNDYFEERHSNPINFFNGGGNDKCLYGQGFVDEILKSTKKIIGENNYNNNNIIIKTTMDVEIQQVIESVLKKEINLINENIYEWHGTLHIISDDQMEILDDNKKLQLIKKYQHFKQYGSNIFVGLMVNDNKILLDNKEIIKISNYHKHKKYLKTGHIFLVKKIDNEYVAYQKPLIEGSIIVMDGRGKILGMVGSNDYLLSSFNRVLKTPIQVSSIMKFFVYAFLMENGINGQSIINDEPVSIEINNNLWEPKNWDKKFMGPMTIEELFILSRNCGVINSVLTIPQWQLKIKKFFYKMGIYNFVPSFIIGSNEMNLNELGLFLAPFINNGYKVKKSTLINEITIDNEISYENSNHLSEQILSQDIIDKTMDTFKKNNTIGLAKNLGIGNNFATKSGTANNNSRFNFMAIGKTEKYPHGIIIICTLAQDNNTAMNGGGSNSTAGKIVAKILHQLN